MEIVGNGADRRRRGWRWWRRRKQRRLFADAALPHVPALYRTARQLATADAAEDLVQETLLRAWTYFDSFEAGTNCRAWLFRILRNVWVDQWRAPRLELPLGIDEDNMEPRYEWEPELVRDALSEDRNASCLEVDSYELL